MTTVTGTDITMDLVGCTQGYVAQTLSAMSCLHNQVHHVKSNPNLELTETDYLLFGLLFGSCSGWRCSSVRTVWDDLKTAGKQKRVSSPCEETQRIIALVSGYNNLLDRALMRHQLIRVNRLNAHVLYARLKSLNELLSEYGYTPEQILSASASALQPVSIMQLLDFLRRKVLILEEKSLPVGGYGRYDLSLYLVSRYDPGAPNPLVLQRKFLLYDTWLTIEDNICKRLKLQLYEQLPLLLSVLYPLVLLDMEDTARVFNRFCRVLGERPAEKNIDALARDQIDNALFFRTLHQALSGYGVGDECRLAQWQLLALTDMLEYMRAECLCTSVQLSDFLDRFSQAIRAENIVLPSVK